MKAFIAFFLCLVCGLSSAAESEKFCNWDHPGSNKYQKYPVEALDDYYMDFQVRAALKAKMEAHQYDDIVEIRREGVFGHGGYRNLRDMHYGKGHYCPGRVSTESWDARQVERALVYCVNEVCVAVPTVCNNVSLIDRDAPIDISPSSGPGKSSEGGAPQPGVDSGPAEPGSQPGPNGHPSGESSPSTPEEPGISGPGVPGFVVSGDNPSGSDNAWPGGPWGLGSGGFGGSDTGGTGGIGGPGCSCITPVPPPCPPPPNRPPVSSVPETPEWILLIVGALCLWRLWVKRDKRYD